MSTWLTWTHLAGLPGMPASDRILRLWGETGRIVRRQRTVGKGWEYDLDSLPPDTRAAYHAATDTRAPIAIPPRAATPARAPTQPQTKAPKATKTPRAITAARTQRSTASADLWAWAEAQDAARREQGAHRALLVRQVVDLIAAGHSRDAALSLVADTHGCSAGTLRTWYTAARQHQPADWAAALIPRARGRAPDSGRIEIHPAAWDWFQSQYLSRRRPTVAEVYRRLVETAAAQGWAPLASEDTFARRAQEIALPTRVYHREGPEALALLIPRQRRDHTVYAPGQAVNGDGLKFDRLWVRWPDGEILNTSTGWFWQDLRTARILAYRLAKTENTDLFRLATYDLTGICLPEAAWIDNTTVAANLAMTGQAAGRHRFHHARRAEDPLGLLAQLGITPHFTDPSREYASPGSKRIERAFGIGGLHTEVANHPRLANQGWSKDTAVPYDVFSAVVAEEVARHNARPKRRTPECGGVRSFDDLWAALTADTVMRVAAESQRRLLLLMVDVCRANAQTGEVKLAAGSSHLGAARYWSDWMPEIRGQQVAVYYDPEDLRRPLTVYSMSGLKLGEAARLADAGHNNTDAAREVRRTRIRQQKAWKKQAEDDLRIDAIVAAEQYPNAGPAVSIPAAGVVRGHFGRGRRVTEDGDLIDLDTGEILDPAADQTADDRLEQQFSASIASLADRRRAAI